MALEIKAFPGDRLSRRSLARYLDAPSAALLVAQTDGRLAGYGLLGLRRGGKNASLYSICADPDLAGRGVGKALMAALERLAAERGRRSMTLEVRSDNLGAIGLYEKLGYVRFGEIEDYYDDGRSALRMRKALV